MNDSDLLAKPECVEYDRNGRVSKIFCKICGCIIAHSLRRGLHRLSRYAEVKIQFADGSHHVTNLCLDCVTRHRKNEDILLAIHEADILHFEKDLPSMVEHLENKRSPRVVDVDVHRRGIL